MALPPQGAVLPEQDGQNRRSQADGEQEHRSFRDPGAAGAASQLRIDLRDGVQNLAYGRVDEGALADLEILFSARGPEEYEVTRSRRQANYSRLPITDAVCERALPVSDDRASHRG